MPIRRYDPDQPPDPTEWQELDEAMRLHLVRTWHEEAGIELPNSRFHAALHVVVENQIAKGDETPVAAAIPRLIGEGLSRHDAIHCVVQAFIEHMHSIMSGRERDGDANQRYYRKVEALTARAWLEQAEPGLPPPRPSRKRRLFRA